MSAYIVDDETIDRSIEAIEHAEGTTLLCEQCDVLGQALLDLNVRAVNERYPNEEPEVASVYHYTPRNKPVMQMFKSLQCLQYQCSEGNVPEDALYKRMDKAFNHLMFEIISNLPEYREAKWA